jgi:HK97 family phage major capsid protein
MAASAKLRADFKAALAEAESLRLAEDRTDEQVTRYKQLLNEVLPSYKSKIEEADALDAVNLDTYKDLSNQTVGTPYSAPVSQVGKTIVGGNGETYDEGDAGNLTTKQFKAISQPEYAKAFKALLHYGEDHVKNNYPRTFKTLVSGIDEGAGYFVPAQMLNELIQRQPAPTTLRGRVRQITTSSNRVHMLRTTYRDDIHTSPINGQWTGEGGSPGASPEPTFGEVQIPVHEYMGRMSMSNTLLEDAGFNLESYFTQELNNWLDLHYEKHIAYGTGIGQPRGIWNSITDDANGVAKAGLAGWVKTSTTGAFDPDTVKSMRFEILPQYARRNFSFIMNQKSAKAISLFKATGGEYLFQRGQVYPGIVEPTPDQIDGFPISYCQFAPDVANDAYAAIFGSLEGYFMPVRLGLSVRVLNEIEAIQNRRVYLFRLRWGGQLVQEQYLKFIKIKGA